MVIGSSKYPIGWIRFRLQWKLADRSLRYESSVCPEFHLAGIGACSPWKESAFDSIGLADVRAGVAFFAGESPLAPADWLAEYAPKARFGEDRLAAVIEKIDVSVPVFVMCGLIAETNGVLFWAENGRAMYFRLIAMYWDTMQR